MGSGGSGFWEDEAGGGFAVVTGAADVEGTAMAEELGVGTGVDEVRRVVDGVAAI